MRVLPAGTVLYHGTPYDFERVRTPAWFAMEMQFASGLARRALKCVPGPVMGDPRVVRHRLRRAARLIEIRDEAAYASLLLAAGVDALAADAAQRRQDQLLAEALADAPVDGWFDTRFDRRGEVCLFRTDALAEDAEQCERSPAPWPAGHRGTAWTAHRCWQP